MSLHRIRVLHCALQHGDVSAAKNYSGVVLLTEISDGARGELMRYWVVRQTLNRVVVSENTTLFLPSCETTTVPVRHFLTLYFMFIDLFLVLIFSCGDCVLNRKATMPLADSFRWDHIRNMLVNVEGSLHQVINASIASVRFIVTFYLLIFFAGGGNVCYDDDCCVV